MTELPRPRPIVGHRRRNEALLTAALVLITAVFVVAILAMAMFMMHHMR
jgi:hypothetical protein